MSHHGMAILPSLTTTFTTLLSSVTSKSSVDISSSSTRSWQACWPLGASVGSDKKHPLSSLQLSLIDSAWTSEKLKLTKIKVQETKVQI